MKRPVFAKDLNEIQNTKGTVLAETPDKRINIVKTKDIYTVWNPEEGFIITHTFCEAEAWQTFKKYSKLGEE